MSQDDQRNQPDEEPPGRESVAGRGAGDATAPGAGTPGGATASERTTVGGVAGGAAAPAQAAPGGATEATAAGTGATEATAAGTATATTGAPHLTPRREFHDPGEGAHRYADPAEEMPRTGSEQSWSAEPHPGYQADPRRRVTTRRLVAGSLVGLVVLGAGAFLGYGVLTLKSSNGNGSAPWTGAVEKHGAVVGGINAQNNDSAPPVNVPAAVTYPASGAGTTELINKAIEACHIAQTTVVPVAAEPGTSVTIGAWATRAKPEMTRLRNDATALETAIGTDNVTQVASAAQTLCAGYPAIAALPPMPDAVGSQHWSAATVAYSVAATDALRGVSGTIAGKPEALDTLAIGHKELDALNARIAEVGAPPVA